MLRKLAIYATSAIAILVSGCSVHQVSEQNKIVPVLQTYHFDADQTQFDIQRQDNILTIKAFSPTMQSQSWSHDITGYSVQNVEIGDLNKDGHPEIFVYLTSHGSGSYGEVIAYSSNNGKSMSQIHIPEVSHSDTWSQGYMGHDQFQIYDQYMVREFPVYLDHDSNANPTGGQCRVTYKMVDGEAGRIMKVDRVNRAQVSLPIIKK